MDRKAMLSTCKLCSVFCLLSVFITSVVLIAVYYDTYSYPNDYAIIFDAGSSGTRMYIYYWQSGLSASRGDTIKINQLEFCKTNDRGIDKFTSKSDVILNFNDCMQLASRSVPQNRKFRTYISLAATAGMRLLNVTNRTVATQILSYISEYFSASDFIFIKNSSQVQIIEGSDEGIDAWISVNYFLNKYTVKTVPTETIGTLDLGGASTQIVFIPDNTTNVYHRNNLKIYGVEFNPFSHSYLCWGANQISLIYQTYLLINNDYGNNAPGSCYPLNYNLTVSTSQILGSPCASGQLFNFSISYNSSRLIQGFQYTIKGTSNATQCANEMSLLFPNSNCTQANSASCYFNGIYLPAHKNSQFYAFSSLYYQFNNTQALVKMDLTTSLNSFKNATNYICSLKNDELLALNANTSAGIQSNFLVTTCFTNNYVVGLLSQYGINSLNNIKFVNEIDGNTVGWTLGYLISQLNREDFLPYEAPPRKLDIIFFIPAISVTSSLLTLSLFILVFYLFRMCRRKDRSYF